MLGLIFNIHVIHSIAGDYYSMDDTFFQLKDKEDIMTKFKQLDGLIKHYVRKYKKNSAKHIDTYITSVSSMPAKSHKVPE